MYYKCFPKSDRGRLRAIMIAVEANKIKLHGLKLQLILDAEAGFFISWFQNELPRFCQNGAIVFSDHMRDKSDKIIRKLWAEIEEQFKHLGMFERVRNGENWGITYIDIRYKQPYLFNEEETFNENTGAPEHPVVKFSFPLTPEESGRIFRINKP